MASLFLPVLGHPSKGKPRFVPVDICSMFRHIPKFAYHISTSAPSAQHLLPRRSHARIHYKAHSQRSIARPNSPISLQIRALKELVRLCQFDAPSAHAADALVYLILGLIGDGIEEKAR
jgi:hypothetical protein